MNKESGFYKFTSIVCFVKSDTASNAFYGESFLTNQYWSLEFFLNLIMFFNPNTKRRKSYKILPYPHNIMKYENFFYDVSKIVAFEICQISFYYLNKRVVHFLHQYMTLYPYRLILKTNFYGKLIMKHSESIYLSLLFGLYIQQINIIDDVQNFFSPSF